MGVGAAGGIGARPQNGPLQGRGSGVDGARLAVSVGVVLDADGLLSGDCAPATWVSPGWASQSPQVARADEASAA